MGNIVNCWEESGEYPNTSTCLLLDGHDGPHEFTPDSPSGGSAAGTSRLAASEAAPPVEIQVGHAAAELGVNMSNTDERIINLNDYDMSTTDDAVIVLQMLTDMHNEPHRLWRAYRKSGETGAWNYEKA